MFQIHIYMYTTKVGVKLSTPFLRSVSQIESLRMYVCIYVYVCICVYVLAGLLVGWGESSEDLGVMEGNILETEVGKHTRCFF